MTSWGQPFEQVLEDLLQANLRRSLNCLQPITPTQFQIPDGSLKTVFCLNDYLGLRHDTRVTEAALKALQENGAGSGASPVAGGYRPIHQQLQQQLALWKGLPSCRLFSSGYTAAMATVQALIQCPKTQQSRPVVFDRLLHACLLDALRLHGSPRKYRSFRHNNPEDLDLKLQSLKQASDPSPLVIVEGLYSMDGDLAPLPAILEVCQRHGAWLLIDDAHATGILGPQGQGSLRHHQITPSPDFPILVMGTLSKTLASQGGYVCGPTPILDWITQNSRAYIFDTALAPACAAAALAALQILQSDPNPLQQLRLNLASFRISLPSAPAQSLESPIFPFHVGDPKPTLQLSQQLLDHGYYIPAIRPPTVPPGTCRLRLAICAQHPPDDLKKVAQLLNEHLNQRLP